MKIKKNVYVVLLLPFVFLMLFIFLSSNRNNFSGIILWDYNVNLEYDDLKCGKIDEINTGFKPSVVLPFDMFDCYYWDEQILVMNVNRYWDSVFKKISELNRKNDESIFFSIVLNDEIVMNGINRLMPSSNSYRKYNTDYNIPKLSLDVVDNYHKENASQVAFFRLSYLAVPGPASIYEHTQFSYPVVITEESLEKLFVKELFEYFSKQNKIILGRIDLDKMYGVSRIK